MAQALPTNVSTSVTSSVSSIGGTGVPGYFENSEVELNPNGNGSIVKEKTLTINNIGFSY